MLPKRSTIKSKSCDIRLHTEYQHFTVRYFYIKRVLFVVFEVKINGKVACPFTAKISYVLGYFFQKFFEDVVEFFRVFHHRCVTTFVYPDEA